MKTLTTNQIDQLLEGLEYCKCGAENCIGSIYDYDPEDDADKAQQLIDIQTLKDTVSSWLIPDAAKADIRKGTITGLTLIDVDDYFAIFNTIGAYCTLHVSANNILLVDNTEQPEDGVCAYEYENDDALQFFNEHDKSTIIDLQRLLKDTPDIAKCSRELLYLHDLIEQEVYDMLDDVPHTELPSLYVTVGKHTYGIPYNADVHEALLEMLRVEIKTEVRLAIKPMPSIDRDDVITELAAGQLEVMHDSTESDAIDMIAGNSYPLYQCTNEQLAEEYKLCTDKEITVTGDDSKQLLIQTFLKAINW